MTGSGDLRIVASADLGGLGDKAGPAAFCHWDPPNILPSMVPWIALLVLLLLKPNRCAQAWWILAPLGSLAAVTTVLPQVLAWLPGPLNQVYADLVFQLAFGTAAAWLLASGLDLRHRVVTFLGLLLVIGVFVLLTFASFQNVSASDPEAILTGIIGSISAFVLALGLTLAGLICRKRYRPVRLCVWALVMFLSLWSLIAAPFLIVAVAANNGPSSVLREFVGPLCAVAGVTFTGLAPFLLLSFWNGFYRERLKHLLKLGLDSAPPPVIQPAPAIPAASVN